MSFISCTTRPRVLKPAELTKWLTKWLKFKQQKSYFCIQYKGKHIFRKLGQLQVSNILNKKMLEGTSVITGPKGNKGLIC